MKQTLKVSLAAITLLASGMSATSAWAHGLLMKAQSEGTTISGTVYYSNGKRASGEWVEVFKDGTSEPMETLRTNEEGEFQTTGEEGVSYRLRASGEEGHEITVALTLAQKEVHAKMVQEDDKTAESEATIPAWAVIGGLLALSAIPAFFLRRRKRS